MDASRKRSHQLPASVSAGAPAAKLPRLSVKPEYDTKNNSSDEETIATTIPAAAKSIPTTAKPTLAAPVVSNSSSSNNNNSNKSTTTSSSATNLSQLLKQCLSVHGKTQNAANQDLEFMNQILTRYDALASFFMQSHLQFSVIVNSFKCSLNLYNANSQDLIKRVRAETNPAALAVHLEMMEQFSTNLNSCSSPCFAFLKDMSDSWRDCVEEMVDIKSSCMDFLSGRSMNLEDDDVDMMLKNSAPATVDSSVAYVRPISNGDVNNNDSENTEDQIIGENPSPNGPQPHAVVYDDDLEEEEEEEEDEEVLIDGSKFNKDSKGKKSESKKIVVSSGTSELSLDLPSGTDAKTRVTTFLVEKLGIGQEQIPNLSKSYRSLFSRDVEADMIPVVEYLTSDPLNFSVGDVGKMALIFPQMFNYRVSDHTTCVEFLNSEAKISFEEAKALLLKNPRFLDPKVPPRLSGVLKYFAEIGLTREEIYLMFGKYPTILSCNLEGKVKPIIKYLEDEKIIGNRSIKDLLLSNWNALNYSLNDRIKARCERMKAAGKQMHVSHIVLKAEAFEALFNK